MISDDSIGDKVIAGSFLKPHPPSGKATPSTSPFVESVALDYSSQVASLMGGRTEIDFQELLPPGSTRKTAARAFSHVLSMCVVCPPYIS